MSNVVYIGNTFKYLAFSCLIECTCSSSVDYSSQIDPSRLTAFNNATFLKICRAHQY